MALYNRLASIIVSDETTSTEISGVRMVFSIEKDNSSKQNGMSIQVTNLSENTRSKIKETGNNLILKVGYTNDSGDEIVFNGDISRVFDNFIPPDVITNIECGDGLNAMREARSSISKSEGVTVSQVISTLANDLGVAVKEITKEIKESFTNGFSFSGPTKKALDSITDSFGLEWSIQDGELQVLTELSTSGERVVLISSDTGLLKSPEPVVSDAQKLTGSKINKPRYIVESLLNPKLRPAGTINLVSNSVEGFFRINSVKHLGDTHGDQWVSTMEVIQS